MTASRVNHRPADGTQPTAPVADAAMLNCRRVTSLDLAFLGYLALTVVLDVAAARLALGWTTAVATTLISAGYLGVLALRRAWRPLLLRLFLLGGVAGLIELATDAAGERVAHSLIYPANEPLLLTSPTYMPLSWLVVLSELGYLGWRVRGLLPRNQALALAGLAGAMIVPFYEEMAFYAGWWRYTPVLRVGHTPLYVLLFEGLISAFLALVVANIIRRPLRHASWLGILVGVWMPCAAFVAWITIGR